VVKRGKFALASYFCGPLEAKGIAGGNTQIHLAAPKLTAMVRVAPSPIFQLARDGVAVQRAGTGGDRECPARDDMKRRRSAGL
jgi:hypothetical protein